jgi:hypothetical protein
VKTACVTKTALITSASRGLGAASAEALCESHHIIAVAKTTGTLDNPNRREQAAYMTTPFDSTIASWPAPARDQFNDMRALILKAAQDADVGPLDESLKWGQPAWRPRRARQGSTLRLNWQDSAPQSLTLYVDCKTTISDTMRDIYPTEFEYETNRALRVPIGAPLPIQAIDHLARLTFTYHRKG